MVKESLKPNKIQDLVFRIPEYLSEMRKMEDDEVKEFIHFLKNYIKEYFSKETDDFDLKLMSLELTDELYRHISTFEVRDVHTEGYFGLVVGELYWELSQKGVLCFFILDNSLRDDRFKVVVELFQSSNFKTIHPYIVEELKYSDNYSQLPVKDYKSIEIEIREARLYKRHIFYVEKDDSVNYIENVLQLANENQSEYVRIFRNNAPNEPLKKGTILFRSEP